jgi:cell division septum initiation protein DivIVA
VTDFDADLDIDLTPPPVGAQYHPAETEEVLLQLRDIIDAARPVPLSASSMIAKDEVLELVDEALASLPEELRAARWLLKEREEFLARTRHEADEIIAQARARAERMVQRTDVVKAAEQRAYGIVDAAEADARRLRHEVEDFCDQKLASFEIVLERTQKLVAAGRAKLQGSNLLAEAAAAAEHGVAGPGPEPLDDEPLAPAAPLRAVDGDEEPLDAGYAEQLAGSTAGYDEDDDDDRGPAPSNGRYADLPPPPAASRPETIRDAAATFFDQDLA